MKAPNVWTLESLSRSVSSVFAEVDGKWIPARPLGLDTISNRLRCAWLAFCGKADLLIWPGGQ